jgi:hypothetical protein
VETTTNSLTVPECSNIDRSTCGRCHDLDVNGYTNKERSRHSIGSVFTKYPSISSVMNQLLLNNKKHNRDDHAVHKITTNDDNIIGNSAFNHNRNDSDQQH